MSSFIQLLRHSYIALFVFGTAGVMFPVRLIAASKNRFLSSLPPSLAQTMTTLSLWLLTVGRPREVRQKLLATIVSNEAKYIACFVRVIHTCLNQAKIPFGITQVIRSFNIRATKDVKASNGKTVLRFVKTSTNSND